MATSEIAMGCAAHPAGTGTIGDRTTDRASEATKSWNWVVRRIVYGSPEASTISSTFRLTW